MVLPIQSSHVHPATIRVWRWMGALVTLGAMVPATFFGAFVLSRGLGLLWPVLPVAVAVTGVLLTWLWPPAYYRYLRYGVDDTGIAIQRGVFWRSKIALSRVRIQHTDVSQGPLQRRFGIGTLKLYTAGTRHTQITLPGLDHREAVSLRDALLGESSGSGV